MNKSKPLQFDDFKVPVTPSTAHEILMSTDEQLLALRMELAEVELP